MKVNDLFEARAGYAPHINDLGKIRGDRREWLKGMGVDAESLEKAYALVKKTPEYKALLALGLKDVSSAGDVKNATIALEGNFQDWSDYYKKVRTSRVKYKVLAHGKIDVVMPNDWHRYDLSTPKPTVVVDNPVQTVVRTMTKSMEKLHGTIEKRIKASEKAVKMGAAHASVREAQEADQLEVHLHRGEKGIKKFPAEPAARARSRASSLCDLHGCKSAEKAGVIHVHADDYYND